MNIDNVAKLLRSRPVLRMKVSKRAAADKISMSDAIRALLREVVSPRSPFAR